ncbi:SLC13 family permease [Burkholderiaceae bacterium FT117]|uniref:SLC13 family permease n=1 Tax=Zeimonas sediminis TaxID=2944268 RepID=UPI002342E455|nr:SLC13 family permease [Zeimonas sediminis]MCM5569569.1 SLC13 family permease [Zeimonas sediminis]
MTTDQMLILAILTVTVAMFLWGRWRHDMVAMGALLACVLAGLVPAGETFAGFGHPAVITVACVLVLSQGLYNSGAVDALTRTVIPGSAGPTVTIAALTALAALLSGFMNNVGALALLMPVAIQVASRQSLPPGKVLMPLAFGSILGGMTTLVGTPPNLIVAGFREQSGAGAFGMFDFTPVGLAVALAGVAFVALVGWRLVPARERAGADSFETAAYLTEARVPEDSKADGMTLNQIETALERAGAQVVGLVRNEVRVTAPSAHRLVRAGDILVIEADVEALAEALSGLGLKLEESKRPAEEEEGEEGEGAGKDEGAGKRRKGDEGEQAGKRDKAGKSEKAGEGEKAGGSENGERNEQRGQDEGDAGDKRRADEIALVELAVLPAAAIAGRSASDIELRTRYGINLLALSRQGRRSTARLRTMAIRPGDVLLMQGPPDSLAQFAAWAGCVPLAERSLRIPSRRKAIMASAIMAASIAVAAFGLLPAAASFALGVLASMALRTVPPRQVYEAVDWTVIVLLAALIPVAGAMEATGTADLIARFLLEGVAQGHAVLALGLILVVTMTLSDLMNNAATAAVMCPIALGAAGQLGVNPDAFLMAVAIGASCAFLTPIGHQNNTLILGPGGFRFGDYWRLGLPLELLVVAVSLPMLLIVWQI